MSYQVLARKYRPRTFAEVVGQEHVVRALVHALDNDRVHHAYLFTGTRGVGKTTIARILAKSLNCDRGLPTWERVGRGGRRSRPPLRWPSVPCYTVTSRDTRDTAVKAGPPGDGRL